MSSRVNWHEILAQPEVRVLLTLALTEDIGRGNLTTESIFSRPTRARAQIITRTETVVAGLPVAEAVFRQLDTNLQLTPALADGTVVGPGGKLCDLEGDLRAILTGERCALNVLMRLCGIATAAHAAVVAVPTGCKARIYDTRKTLPGWRRLDKAAVRAGGAENHRFGLFDAVLIKDNHIAAAGSVRKAIELARAHAGAGVMVEVEVDRLDQLEEALQARPDIVLLDNFSEADMQEAVARTGGRAELEASGGVTLSRVAVVAATGVDRISLGSLTHTVRPADLSLEVSDDGNE